MRGCAVFGIVRRVGALVLIKAVRRAALRGVVEILRILRRVRIAAKIVRAAHAVDVVSVIIIVHNRKSFQIYFLLSTII